MASTFSQNRGFELQATGDHNGTWGVALNAVLSLLDQIMGASVGIATTGGASNIASASLDYARWNITGALGSNATLTVQLNAAAQAVSGYFVVDNVTTGNFTVTIASVGGGRTAVIPRGRRTMIFIDGTNVDVMETPSIIYCGSTGGTTTAYTATVPGSTSSLSNGQTFMVLINATCGNQPTMNLTMAGVAVGALAMYRPSTSGPVRVGTSEMLLNQLVQFTYDSTLNAGAGGFHVLGGTAASVSSTFLDNAFRIQDNGDTTKQLAFEASGITTGTTRTVTVLDVDGTMVLQAATQTLTNKSLTSPIVTGSPTAAGSTWADLGAVTTIDINGGTVDGTPIGNASRSTGKFTTLDASTSLTIGATIYTGLMKQGLVTMSVPAGAMKARTTNGASSGTVESATNKVMQVSMDFPDGATTTYAQFALQMPKSWDLSTVTAQFDWTANSASTNSVVWQIQAVALSDTNTIDTAFGTAVTVTDANGASVYTLRQSAVTGAITIGNTPAAKDWVVFQVFRDPTNGSDNLAATACLLCVNIFLTQNAADDT